MTTPDHDDELALAAAPWARVERVNLIRREVRESLSPNALEILFSRAEVVVESGTDPSGEAVYGTVMLTFDLSRCSDLVREPADAATALRLSELLAADKKVARRLATLARPYLSEAAETSVPMSAISMDFKVRVEDERVLIDGDGMVSLRELHSTRPLRAAKVESK